ncbi:hypothetical protein BJY04DRAFT_224966 [Aspergillus karnatakaensis]|uniref:uncharacterized protein n=1 Tax=Aspergillus karnatakaensis TaxID=1810916 RepID=UPI003CCCBB39
MFTPLSQGTPNPTSLQLIPDCASTMLELPNQSAMIGEFQSIGMLSGLEAGSRDDPSFSSDPSSWFLGAGLDVDALDFTLSSAVSEWAQLPPPILLSNPTDVPTSSYSSGPIPTVPQELLADSVSRRWFTRHVVEEGSPRNNSQATLSSNHEGGSHFGQGNLAADEDYRARLSQTLQPRLHNESLPSSDRLNLFASLFFSRFNSLLPIVHVPSFKPTMENSLLFISICSVGSLFVGSGLAVAQGTRLFERLNKAILASWESVLSQSRSNALSMVQAAVIGQTFAILSGRPKTLMLADVLHGTVMAWARESDKHALQPPLVPQNLDPGTTGADLDEQWTRWIDQEQRRRVETALNIHDAELASLLHHEPLRKHRLSTIPCVASDELFTAPIAPRWAELYKKSPITQDISLIIADVPLHAAVRHSRFAVYGVLECINAHVIEARRSNTLDEHESRRLSSVLMQWWRIYTNHFSVDSDNDPFSLPVLWHSVFLGIYADVDLLEQAIGRDGESRAADASSRIRSWATSLDASKCLVHAILIHQYLERMRVSAEPAIHVPRAIFTAALAWFCFTRLGSGHTITTDAFDAPEIRLVGNLFPTLGSSRDAQSQGFGEASTFASVSYLHRLIDLMGRFGRWGISESFSSILCAALESKQSG